MQTYEIITAPSAENDIKEITAYLTHHFSEDIARKYSAYINETIQSLKTMPKRCSLVRDSVLREKGYRWVSVFNYTIFFLVEENPEIVRIQGVLYAKRQYSGILDE